MTSNSNWSCLCFDLVNGKNYQSNTVTETAFKKASDLGIRTEICHRERVTKFRFVENFSLAH